MTKEKMTLGEFLQAGHCKYKYDQAQIFNPYWDYDYPTLVFGDPNGPMLTEAGLKTYKYIMDTEVEVEDDDRNSCISVALLTDDTKIRDNVIGFCREASGCIPEKEYDEWFN